jgi:hypothetical protein
MLNNTSIQFSTVISRNQTISTKVYNYGYYPLVSGDIAPLFHFNREAFVSVQHYFDLQQPLSIVFFDFLQPNHLEVIGHLAELQNSVQHKGGNLIIITNNASKTIKKEFAKFNNLTVFFDLSNELFEQFGLYDEANPLSNWISGIDDENGVLPALYVVTPDRQIVYHQIDYSLQIFSNSYKMQTTFDQLLDSVSKIANSDTYLSRWKNKLVS